VNQAGESRPGSFTGSTFGDAPSLSCAFVAGRLPTLTGRVIAARADRISQAPKFRRNQFCSSSLMSTRAKVPVCPASGASRCGRDAFWQDPPGQQVSGVQGVPKLLLRTAF